MANEDIIIKKDAMEETQIDGIEASAKLHTTFDLEENLFKTVSCSKVEATTIAKKDQVVDTFLQE